MATENGVHVDQFPQVLVAERAFRQARSHYQHQSDEAFPSSAAFALAVAILPILLLTAKPDQMWLPNHRRAEAPWIPRRALLREQCRTRPGAAVALRLCDKHPGPSAASRRPLASAMRPRNGHLIPSRRSFTIEVRSRGASAAHMGDRVPI